MDRHKATDLYDLTKACKALSKDDNFNLIVKYLENFSGYNKPLLSTDAHELAMNEGARRLYLRLHRALYMSSEEFERLHEQNDKIKSKLKEK